MTGNRLRGHPVHDLIDTLEGLKRALDMFDAPAPARCQPRPGHPMTSSRPSDYQLLALASMVWEHTKKTDPWLDLYNVAAVRNWDRPGVGIRLRDCLGLRRWYDSRTDRDWCG